MQNALIRSETREATIREFTKTSLVNLVIRQLEQSHPHLVGMDASEVDPIREARFPANRKRDLLERILKEAGPGVILKIGQGIREVGFDPVWGVAINSASPSVFFDKWRRFETFAHWTNRLRIEQEAGNRARFHRYAVGGGAPTSAENLLICGLSVALLGEIGCRGLRCDMWLDNGASFTVLRDGKVCVPDRQFTLRTNSWTASWDDCCAASHPKPAPDLLTPPFPRQTTPKVSSALDEILGLLLRDVARQWKIADLAREAAMSQRSLQRRLHEAGVSFSQLVRLVRIREACRLLERNDLPVTAVGFCAGFSDSAHFSRDFKASMGMTPSEYRDVV